MTILTAPELQPIIHVDPTIQNIVKPNEAVAASTMFKYGLKTNDVKHIHIADDSESYKAAVEADIDYDLGLHVVIGIGEQLNQLKRRGLPYVERSINRHIHMELARLAAPAPNIEQKQRRQRMENLMMGGYLSLITELLLEGGASTELRALVATSVGMSALSGLEIQRIKRLHSEHPVIPMIDKQDPPKIIQLQLGI
jgi:hypothetical protein